jgi:hypothetical protein
VRTAYIRQIEALGARVRHISNWLNAAGFDMPSELVAQVYHLPFVYDIKPAGVAPNWTEKSHSQFLNHCHRCARSIPPKPIDSMVHPTTRRKCWASLRYFTAVISVPE